MPNLLNTGMQWLGAQLQEHAAEDVTYRRGNVGVRITAVRGSKILRVSDGRGETKVIRPDLDFLIRAEDLDLGAGMTDPERGDRIEIEEGDGIAAYEVMAPAPGEPHYRLPDGVTFRIHTRRKGRVE